ncbi:MAG: type 1 glutamine amidotransferase [Dokdonella sp.]
MIAVSPRILHQVPAELGFHDKTLQYLEQSVPHWIMAQGALAMMVPTSQRDSLVRPSAVDATDYAAAMDGLVLQGGTDLDPILYGEANLHAIGPFDATRDRYEMALLRAFVAAGKPVLGICRGMQLINVAYGGSLYQDLLLQQGSEESHVQSTLYDHYSHSLHWPAHGWLASLHPDVSTARVNSIHHQAIKTLGRGLVAEAWSEDGVIEMLRATGSAWLVGVQWHPEFHDGRDPGLLPADPLMQAFLHAAARARTIGRETSSEVGSACPGAQAPHFIEENHHA